MDVARDMISLNQMLKKSLFWEMLILSLITGTLHTIATVYHLYWSIYEFDSMVHFLGGVSLSLLFLWLYFFSGYFNPSKRNLGKFLLVSILGAMFISMLWETYELIFRQTMVHKIDYPYDLSMDLIMDLLGAVAGCFYGYIKKLKGEKI